MIQPTRISKEVQFDAGHRVPNHNGKCCFPHGHRYRVVVTCEGNIIEDPRRADHGMLVDFGNLKQLMMEHIHDVLDHKFIVFIEDTKMMHQLDIIDGLIKADRMSYFVFPYVPTAENIARWCYEQLELKIKGYWNDDLTLYSVQIWETPTSEATYYGSLESEKLPLIPINVIENRTVIGAFNLKEETEVDG